MMPYLNNFKSQNSLKENKENDEPPVSSNQMMTGMEPNHFPMSLTYFYKYVCK